MNFKVTADVMALQDVNSILSQHRGEQVQILDAFREIIDELKRDAHMKGTAVRRMGTYRVFCKLPLKATYRVVASQVIIRRFRYA